MSDLCFTPASFISHRAGPGFTELFPCHHETLFSCIGGDEAADAGVGFLFC